MARSWRGGTPRATLRPKIAVNPPAGHVGARNIRERPRLLLSVALLGLSAAAPAADAACPPAIAPGLVRVTVEVSGVRSSAGEVAFTVYPDRRDRFLAKGGKLSRVRTRAVSGTTSACFALAPGYYPIAIYHDANGDRDFNRTLIAPKEGFGFSNDPPTTFGIPSFDKVRIRIGPGPTTIRIRMRYP